MSADYCQISLIIDKYSSKNNMPLNQSRMLYGAYSTHRDCPYKKCNLELLKMNEEEILNVFKNKNFF